MKNLGRFFMKHSGITSSVYILLGFILLPLINLLFLVIFKINELGIYLQKFKYDWLEEFQLNISFSIWITIPFIFNGLLYYFIAKKSKNRNSYYIKGVILSGLITLVSSILIYFYYFMYVYGIIPRDPRGVSTASIGFLFVPFYILTLSILSYLIVLIFGKFKFKK